jgi:galactokinase
MAVGRRLARNFPGLAVGADIAFRSTIPRAAGMSTSSALITAVYLVLAQVNRLSDRPAYQEAIPTREALAGYLGSIENGQAFGGLRGDQGVGTFGGSEDHTAILSARPNALVQYSFCPVRHEQTVDLPPEHVFVIATSGVVAEKTGAALESYNRLATLARSATERWRAASGRSDATLGDALRSAAGDVEPILDSIRSASEGDDAALVERVRQFAIESESTIPAAVEALASGRLAELGALVDRSMLNAERMLHNQISETIFLARRARELGAIAASAFGAGFGGSVWALASHAHAESLAARLAADYRERFPQHADLAEAFVTQAGPPAATI